MAEMTKWQFYYTAWLSQPFMYGAISAMVFMPAAPFVFLAWMVLGWITMWFGPWFMWGDRSSLDFPTGSYPDNHAIAIMTINPEALSKAFIMMILQVADVVQTPGGLKINEELINNWRTKLNDPNTWGNDIDFYIFDWWQWTLIDGEPDIVANTDGDYKVGHLLVDLGFLALMVGLVLVLAKKGKGMATTIGGVFGKQLGKKRRKESKQREKLALVKLDELAAKAASEASKLTLLDIKELLKDEIEPDVKTLLNRKNLRI